MSPNPNVREVVDAIIAAIRKARDSNSLGLFRRGNTVRIVVVTPTGDPILVAHIHATLLK